MIYNLGEHKPDTYSACYIAASATIIGNVKLANAVTIWPSAVIRADIASVVVGENSSVQDNATIHVDLDLPCKIGCNVSIGHNAILHSCTIEDNVIIGMGSIVLNNSHIGKNCIVGAGSLVTNRLPLEEGCLIMGSPAKIVRKLTEDEIKHIQENADHYQQTGLLYKTSLQEQC